MRTKKTILKLVAGLVFAVSASMAHATAISFNYVASVAGGVGTVTGTFGYDDSVSDTIPSDSTESDFPAAGFLTGSVSGGPLNGMTFNKTNLFTFIFDNRDSTLGYYDDAFAINDSSLTFIEFDSVVSSSTPVAVPPLNSDQLDGFLPAALTNLAGWDRALVVVYDGQIQEGYTLTEVTRVAQAPEPYAIALLGIGLAGLGFQRRKQIKAA